jgi:hypothetical protein
MRKREAEIVSHSDELHSATAREQSLGDMVSEVLGLLASTVIAAGAWQWWSGELENFAVLPLALVATIGSFVSAFLLVGSTVKMVHPH